MLTRPSAPILQVRLFGGLSIDRDDWPAAARLTRGAETLFSHLILERRRSHSRDELAGLFWGDMPDDRARNCLNTALWRLRRVLERDPGSRGMYVETTPSGDVRFNAASEYWLDVAVFEEALDALLPVRPEQLDAAAARRLESAVDLYTGDLLGGVFDDWALAERERLRARYVDAQVHLMRAHRSQGDVQQSIAYGRRVLAADPLREEIHRELMGAYHDAGQSAQAVRQYEVCRDLLRNELGIAPEAETQALRSSLGSLDSGPAPRSSARELQLALDLVTRATEALRDAEARLAAALRAVDGTGDGRPAAPASPARSVDADAVSHGRSDGDRAVTGA